MKNRVSSIKFYKAGKFKTDVYNEGKLVNTVTSEYNPIKPAKLASTRKIL